MTAWDAVQGSLSFSIDLDRASSMNKCDHNGGPTGSPFYTHRFCLPMDETWSLEKDSHRSSLSSHPQEALKTPGLSLCSLRVLALTFGGTKGLTVTGHVLFPPCVSVRVMDNLAVSSCVQNLCIEQGTRLGGVRGGILQDCDREECRMPAQPSLRVLSGWRSANC